MITIVLVFALFSPCIRRSATSQGCTKRCGTGIGRSGMAGNLEDICFVSQFVFVSDFDLFSFQTSAIFFGILNVLVILASSKIIKNLHVKNWTWSCT